MLGLERDLLPVANTRGGIGKKSMILNDATPVMEVDPETYEVRADGELLTCEPATSCRSRSGIPVLMAEVLRRAERVASAGDWPADLAAGSVVLTMTVDTGVVSDFLRRRRLFSTSQRQSHCALGDGLATEDGAWIAVRRPRRTRNKLPAAAL